MTRPCDDCGGTGIGVCPADTDGDGNCAACTRQPGIHVCVACKDMPWLTALCFSRYMEEVYLFNTYAPEWWKQDERGKPDPSTVMQWCQVHQSTIDDDALKCHYWHRWKVWKEYEPDCDVVWIAKPTPLPLCGERLQTLEPLDA